MRAESLFRSFCRHKSILVLIIVLALAQLPKPAPVLGDEPEAKTPGQAVQSGETEGIVPEDKPSPAEVDPAARAPDTARSGERPAPVATKSASGKVMINFVDADIKDIIKTMAELTGKNFMLAPGVTARISVQTVKPVDSRDVFSIFESILSMNSLSAVKAGPYYKIVPSQSAKQLGVGVVAGKDAAKVAAGDGFVNLVVPVDYVQANDLVQILKPLLSVFGNIAIHAKTNTIIVTDMAANVKKAIEIINILDVDVFERMNVTQVPVSRVDVKTLAKELDGIFQAMGFPRDSPQVSIVPIERLNSLIVISQTPELLGSVKTWIERLDAVSGAEGTSIHVYYVQNEKASNIKSILDQVFAGDYAYGAGASRETEASAEGMEQRTAMPGASKPRRGRASEGSTEGEEIRIHVYEPTNALIIQSSRRQYQAMLNTIQELDRPPKQVLIDAVVMEVALDENTRHGIQWSALTGNWSLQQNTGIVSDVLNDPGGDVNTPIGLDVPSGLTALATDASRFFAVIQALASEGKVNVLSNPHILVKNYEKASITVGSDEPIATQSTQTEVTGTSSLIQNIEYRKTGVILTVSPQITEGGVVAMTIRQEISDISTSRVVGSGTFPSFTKREAETSIVARDGETIVIGGLIEERTDRTTTGIPLLSKIPLLGNLFRATRLDRGKTELVILFTPTVVAGSTSPATVIDEMKSKLKGLREMYEKKEEM